ncbi:hypothetical protein [Streptomyces sp. NPDC088794]|uniref:hypothetical protein n=1 Tax=Streptomyces sp. NPDC088794 TaxID=3365902 RepID=UPI00381D3B96
MNRPAALPGAALRVMRTAVGRRALQVALLVGGLFAVGLLCGEQAQAADGVTSGSSVRPLTVHVVGQLLKPRAPAGVRPLKPPRPTELPRPPKSTESPRRVKPVAVADHVVQSVNGGVLEPVGGVVQAVTDELGEVTAQIPPLSSLPILSSLPDLPALPTLPTLPTQPEPPEAPGQTLPAPTPAPVVQAPQPDGAGHTTGRVPGKDNGKARGRSGSAEVGSTTYGPLLVVDAGAVGHVSAPSRGQRVAGAGYAPVHQAPGGDPSDGAAGSRSGVDGGSSRHGDAHAVALTHRVPLRFVAGAAGRSGAAEIRDRHRDIPVSPA